MKGHTPEATCQSGRNIGLPASLVAGLMPHLNPRAVDTGSNDVRAPAALRVPRGWGGYRPEDWGTSRACAKMVRKNRLRRAGLGGDHI